MKIYFCKKCHNILGEIDDFKNFYQGDIHFISRSHRSMESKSLKEFYETTCTKCKTHCTFSQYVQYQELSTSEKLKRIKENNEYDMILNPTGIHLKRNGEIIFDSNTVIRHKDLSKKQRKKFGVDIQKFHLKKLEKQSLEEQQLINKEIERIEKIKTQRQKEEDEYWERFISKYPLFGISNWLFGKK